MKRRIGVLALALAVLLPAVAAAQGAQVGQLKLEVRDANGGALPGASVLLTSQELGFTRRCVTDTQGACVFAALPMGRYDVSARLDSFEAALVIDNLVEADRTTALAVTLKITALVDSTVVKGEVPIVDQRNQTLQTRLRAEEFDRMPYGRSFLALLGQVPGVVGTGNVHAHGALGSNNLFLIDGVDITDTTTGTSAGEVHFEAVQEVVVRTSALPAEFGRATGAIVDVITRSGTNLFDVSARFFVSNDLWNGQNSTRSQVAPFAPLARERFDRVNPVTTLAVGGPVSKNRLWFFVSMQDARETTPQRQTNAAAPFPPENYQEVKKFPFATVRLNAQMADNHSAWIKYDTAPTRGFVVDHFGEAAERKALTSQEIDQSAFAGQYTGVFAARWTAEVMMARVTNRVAAQAFETSPLESGAPVVDLTDGRAYNGSGVVGETRRPRFHANAAVSFLARLAGKAHDLKIGIDWQDARSESLLAFPSGTLFLADSFDPVSRTFEPFIRQDYDTQPSISTGREAAVYVRDKFDVGRRISVNAGVRFERQTSRSDVGELTVRSFALAPRVSASLTLTEDAKTIAIASYGRYHDNILLQYANAFSALPQQANYDNFAWDGTAYVFTGRVEQAIGSFRPNLDVTPRRLDEFTIGVERQLNHSFGASIRAVERRWGNFIDDVRAFDAGGGVVRTVENLPFAWRRYHGLEMTLDRRWADGWAASASYTYSHTRGNHFADDFTPLGDYLGAFCQQGTDPGLGDANGIFPCHELQVALAGRPTFDRPHLIKANGTITRPFGKMDLTLGAVAAATSKTTFSKQRTVNVLLPGTAIPSGQTLPYYYDGRGSDRVTGLATALDVLVEAAFQPMKGARLGVRAEVFNVFNSQSQIDVNNTAWCDSVATPSCQAAVGVFGTATSRGSFQTPRAFRFAVVFRYR